VTPEEILAAMEALRAQQRELTEEHAALRDQYNLAARAQIESLQADKATKLATCKTLSDEVNLIDAEIRRLEGTLLR
jgi:hypothetical protein